MSTSPASMSPSSTSSSEGSRTPSPISTEGSPSSGIRVIRSSQFAEGAFTPSPKQRKESSTSESVLKAAKKSQKVTGSFFKSPACKFLGLVILGVGFILAIHFGAAHIPSFHHLPVTKQILIKKISTTAAGITFIGGPIAFLRQKMIHQFAMDATLKHQLKDTVEVKNKETGKKEKRSAHWYNQISPPTFGEIDEGRNPTPDLPKILLSMIPLLNEDAKLSEEEKAKRGEEGKDTSMVATLLHKEGVTRFLSVNEAFENEVVGNVAKPVTEKDWKKLGFRNAALYGHAYQGSKVRLRIPAKDYEPMTLHHLQEGVRFLEATESSETVDVHCKAGRGRSAAVLAAFFLKKFYVQYKHLKKADPSFSPVDSIIKHLRSQRAWVTIGSKQKNAIVDYWNDLVRIHETEADRARLEDKKDSISLKAQVKTHVRGFAVHGIQHF